MACRDKRKSIVAFGKKQAALYGRKYQIILVGESREKGEIKFLLGLNSFPRVASSFVLDGRFVSYFLGASFSLPGNEGIWDVESLSRCSETRTV